MKKTLIAFLLFTFTTPISHAAPESKVTISGTILDKNGDAIIGAAVIIPGTTTGATTDLDGKFSLKTEQEPTEIQISSLGYQTKQLLTKDVNGKTIILDESQELLDATIITDKIGDPCTPSDPNALPYGTYQPTPIANGRACKPQGCKFNTYKVEMQSNGDKGYKFVCVLDPNKNRLDTPCTNAEIEQLKAKKRLDEHAAAGTVNTWDIETGEVLGCKITECKKDYKPNMDGMLCISTKCSKCGEFWDEAKNKCVSRIGQSCKASNAKTATYKCNDKGEEFCEIESCLNDTEYTYDKESNSCIFNNGQPCTADDPNAIAYYHKKDGKLVCQIDACKDGYKLVNGKCEVRTAISDEDLKKLQDNAEKMHENETSLANKTLGATGMGTVGIGGMMATSALSEQRLDAQAERDMRAYLETFRCDYGSGKDSKGGETDIELPGGNDMFNLYAQYATLASDLKTRKEALGIKPGIESEVIIDKAETGLYDDVGTGIVGGAYASVARAIQNPDGEDAKLWNAQKEKTAENLKTGAIVAGVGAAATLAGNIALNSGENKQNKTNDILANAKPADESVQSKNTDDTVAKILDSAQSIVKPDESVVKENDDTSSSVPEIIKEYKANDTPLNLADLKTDIKGYIKTKTNSHIDITDVESQLVQDFITKASNKWSDLALGGISDKYIAKNDNTKFYITVYSPNSGTNYDKVCASMEKELCSNNNGCYIALYSHGTSSGDFHHGCGLVKAN